MHSLPGLFWLHKCVLLPLPNRSLHSFRLLALLLRSLQSEGSSPVLVCRRCLKQVFPWGFRRQRQGFWGDPKAVVLGSIWKKVMGLQLTERADGELCFSLEAASFFFILYRDWLHLRWTFLGEIQGKVPSSGLSVWGSPPRSPLCLYRDQSLSSLPGPVTERQVPGVTAPDPCPPWKTLGQIQKAGGCGGWGLDLIAPRARRSVGPELAFPAGSTVSRGLS